MGALTSRQNAGVEEVDIVSNHAYKYPPKSGNYFGNHFIMGGEKFDTPQPEAYLFGENADLNFLGSRPTPFPYPPPQANEPTKTLKSLVNIRKESLRLVRALDDGGGGCKSDVIKAPCFNIEFTFDCDARTAITIYYFAQEEITPNGVVYVTKEPSHSSETFYYKRGTGQLFSQPSHVFDPSQYSDEELSYNPDKEIIPIAIHCVAQEGTEELRQSHTCIAVVDRHSDGTYVLKTLKQKLFVDGLCYLLQEIYGIENKTNEIIKGGSSDDDTQDNGSECVICICEVRDTLILPCRHLCLCNSCADSLRYQASSCPICRAPFRALLQIRALQKAAGGHVPMLPTPEGSCENIPAGYEAVSLIEALNGPCQRTTLTSVEPTDASDADASVQAADVLNRSSLERIPKVKLVGSPEDYETEGACPTPEFRMSVLLSRGADSAGAGKARDRTSDVIQGSQQLNKASWPLLVTSSQAGRGRATSSQGGKAKQALRDTVRIVNETSNSHDETEDVDSEAEKLSPLLTSVVVGGGGGAAAGREDTEEDDEEEVVHHLGKTKGGVTASLMPRDGAGDGDGLNQSGGGAIGGSHGGGGAGGEDSDYYTPEDPATTILSPLHTDKDRLPEAPSAVGSLGVAGGPRPWSGVGEMGVATGVGPRPWSEVGGAGVGVGPRPWTGGVSLPGTPLSTASHRSSGDSYSSSGSTRLLLDKNATRT
ncbi:hypothetical protein LSTR_LSTR011124 [Laodelphax striatellus]|uniref:RING-type E3 ubiquitin transferase n=1 Tax=Laodelphax striatellus TaxID=195883 RepID=A0A482XIZ2_LAOST|nr:hypothetical protein LSTR_LSTR011124 [Laodelphax striatellus]